MLKDELEKLEAATVRGRAHPLNTLRANALNYVLAVEGGGMVVDPLAKYLQSDQVLAEVRSEGSELSNAYLRGMGWNCLYWPCYIPNHLLCWWTPCGIPFIQNQANDCGANVRLVLRENSLVYQQGKCRCPKLQPGAPIYTLYDACKPFELPEVEIWILLAPRSDDQPKVEVSMIKACRKETEYYSADTIVVRVGGEVLVALDAPVGGAEFVEACEKQIQIACAKRSEVLQSIPVGVLDAHDATIRLWLDSVPKSQLVVYELMTRSDNNRMADRHGTLDLRVLYGEITVKARLEFKPKYDEYQGIVNGLMDGQGRYINGQYIPTAGASEAAAPIAAVDMVRDNGVHSPSLLNLSIEDVCSLLSIQVGLAKHYVEAFREHRVDGALLNMMDEDSLKELGIDSSLERKKILAWVIMKQRELAKDSA